VILREAQPQYHFSEGPKYKKENMYERYGVFGPEISISPAVPSGDRLLFDIYTCTNVPPKPSVFLKRKGTNRKIIILKRRQLACSLQVPNGLGSVCCYDEKYRADIGFRP
jgi:hypothetical protein